MYKSILKKKNVLTHLSTANAVLPGVKDFSPQNYLGDHQKISHPQVHPIKFFDENSHLNIPRGIWIELEVQYFRFCDFSAQAVPI